MIDERSLSNKILAPVLVALLAGFAPAAGAQGRSEPCDIYRAAGAECAAAHSTVRALYRTYAGLLYRITRQSDGGTLDIGVLSRGGYADAAAQDRFCADTSCVITRIYDQSPMHNDLTVESKGAMGYADHAAPAGAEPAMVGGHKVYGVQFSESVGYRNDRTAGVAVNGEPEGMLMVVSGTRFNNKCCFDYGNAETNNADTGNGHMDAVYFGTLCWFGGCFGTGPWVQADMENGMFQSGKGVGQDPDDTGIHAHFVTALLKNNGRDRMAIKFADAQSGTLTTTYAGGEPTVNGGGYAPMHQEGAILLGTGGDNSNKGIGTFFEGLMTKGYPSEAADDAVQANIVGAGYGRP